MAKLDLTPMHNDLPGLAAKKARLRAVAGKMKAPKAGKSLGIGQRSKPKKGQALIHLLAALKGGPALPGPTPVPMPEAGAALPSPQGIINNGQ